MRVSVEKKIVSSWKVAGSNPLFAVFPDKTHIKRSENLFALIFNWSIKLL